MSVVTLTINDELVSARSGQSLLEVIRERDIYIPTLCHLEGLSERGGCRSCSLRLRSGAGYSKRTCRISSSVTP